MFDDCGLISFPIKYRNSVGGKSWRIRTENRIFVLYALKSDPKKSLLIPCRVSFINTYFYYRVLFDKIKKKTPKFTIEPLSLSRIFITVPDTYTHDKSTTFFFKKKMSKMHVGTFKNTRPKVFPFLPTPYLLSPINFSPG